MKLHELKSWPDYYESVALGIKRFEIRENDRNFYPGDLLHLREWDPATEDYTGRHLVAKVLDIWRDLEWVERGYVVMSIVVLEPRPSIE